MTRLFIALLIALLAPALLTAAVPRTIIVGSLNLPSGGNPGTTVITLTPSTNFAVSDGTTKYNVVAPVTYSVSNSAALFMYVVPNTGSSNVPDYTTYTAQIKSNDKIVSTQTWQVGTNALPVQVADVIVSTSTTMTPTAALPLVGGTMLGKITLGSTSLISGLRWPLSTAPSSPEEGDTYISSVDGKLYIRYLGAWTTASGATPSPAQTLEGTRKITTTAALALGTTAASGTSVDAAAGDHRHPGPAATVNGVSQGNVTSNLHVGDVTAGYSSGALTLTYKGPPVATFGGTLNVSSTSATTVQITADELVVSDGTTNRILSAVNVSPSSATAGPAVNGRDQSGAFAGSTWIYGYVIWGSGQTTAGLWSLSATAPTLPTNYTHKALVTAANTDAGTGPVDLYVQQGRRVRYVGPQTSKRILSAGHATTFTHQTVALYVPPAARIMSCNTFITPNTAGNQAQMSCDGSTIAVVVSGTVAAHNSFAITDLPVSTNRGVFYKVSNASDSFYIDVLGWEW